MHVFTLSLYTCGSSCAFWSFDLAEVSDLEVCPICRISQNQIRSYWFNVPQLFEVFLFCASVKHYFKLNCLAVLNDRNRDTMLLQSLKWFWQLPLVCSSFGGTHAT